jgi:hypothetical protein
VEAVGYIIKFDRVWIREENKERNTIRSWAEYMDYVQDQLSFAPDYTQWDKNTRELERLADAALNASKKVIEEHNPPEKRLPKEIVEGIYTRTRMLHKWKKIGLHLVRAQEDYKEWKGKKDAASEPSQCRWSHASDERTSRSTDEPPVRRRRRPLEESLSTIPPLTATSTTFDIPKEHGRLSKIGLLNYQLQVGLNLQKLWESLLPKPCSENTGRSHNLDPKSHRLSLLCNNPSHLILSPDTIITLFCRLSERSPNISYPASLRGNDIYSHRSECKRT